MAQRCFFVFCVIFSVTTANNPQPRDLLDEVNQQIFELGNIAYAEIANGRNKVQDLEREFRDDAQKVSQKANIDLQQEHETINSQLTTIKDLAQLTGNDVSSCTNGREDILNNLPANYGENIGFCIDGINESVSATVSDARYLIDVFVNKVHHFELQVNQCQESLECISPLLTQILEEKIQMPLRVKEEVQYCSDIVSELELSVQSCGDEYMAEYILEANTILREITDCAEGIIG